MSTLRTAPGPARRLHRGLVMLCAIALATTGFVLAGPVERAVADSAPVEPGVDATVTADALPTVQIDGVAWSQVVVGNRVYVAGEFTTARPAGAPSGVDTTPRANLLAYDLTTGELVTSWNVTLDGPAYAIAASPDGSRIYVGGDFTRVNGSSRNRFAVVTASTGSLVTSFTGGANAAVRAIAVTPSAVYIGGNFNTVAGQSRPRVASFNAQTGALRDWRASVQSAQVDSLAVSPDGSRLFVGGRFEKINNVERLGNGALATSDAALLPWTLNPEIYHVGFGASLNSLSIDENYVYGTGFTFLAEGMGEGNLEGAFAADPVTGDIVWIADCHGDSYAVFPNPGQDHVYVAGHPHMCSNFGGYPEVFPRQHYYGVAFTKQAYTEIQPNTQSGYQDMAGHPAPEFKAFLPTFSEGTFTGTNQATWHVAGSSDVVAYAGEFLRVNGTPQEGLVRFAKNPVAPGDIGPAASGSQMSLVGGSHAQGTAQLSWVSNWDRDNLTLTYRITRSGGGQSNLVVGEVQAPSQFWQRPRLSFSDSGLASSTTYQYRVTAVDANDNEVQSSQVSVTTGSAAPLSTYAAAVLADGPSNYWRFGESSGSIQDFTANADVTLGSGVQRNQDGAIAGDDNGAVAFTGTNSSRAYSTRSEQGQHKLSVEAWFRTTTDTGGKLVGLGSTQGTGGSQRYDRHIYMSADGRLNFGVDPNEYRVVTSSASYNDDQWHHVVGTVGTGGLELWVDGARVAHDPTVGQGRMNFNGYWRIGGDNLSGAWPNAGSTNFDGYIDEVAIYPRQLSQADILEHFGIGTDGVVPNLPPSASFSVTSGVLTAEVDAGASSDPDGSIASYEWAWGDGATGTGVTASHDYASAGTYTVELTVTDNQGLSASTTQDVVVTAPNVPPVAAFTTSVEGLTVTLDGAGSNDPDGTITDYAWNLAQGVTANGVTAVRTFAAPGSYLVSLTVTDDDGESTSTSQTVEVSEPTVGVVAQDGFGRTVASGWGNADVGGSWTTTSGVASVSGGQGVLNLAGANAVASARLPGAEGIELTTSTSLTLDKRPSGSGAWSLLRGRITPSGEYRLKTNLRSNGSISAWFVRTNAAGQETAISSTVTIPGASYNAGTQIRSKLEVTGASPTSLRAKVWTGGSEPAGWHLQTTDAQSGLQVPGHTGIGVILSSSTNNGPVIARFDDYLVEGPGGAPVEENLPPVAQFTVTASELEIELDASSSSDPDGTIASYEWELGDGGSSSGVTTSHTYAGAGTYPVTLTVTDDGGESTSSVQQVSVTAGGSESGRIAEDTFTRSVGSGWDSADLGGPWTLTSGYGSVESGQGVLSLSGGGAVASARLPGASGLDLTTRANLTLDRRPNGSGAWTLLRGRITPGGEYRLKTSLRSNGSISAWFVRTNAAGQETNLTSQTVIPGASYNAGSVISSVLEVSGTSPTTLRAKIWTGGAEPAAWQLQTTDSTAALQGEGHTGLAAILSGSVSNGPVRFGFDNFSVDAPVEEPPADDPPADDPPGDDPPADDPPADDPPADDPPGDDPPADDPPGDDPPGDDPPGDDPPGDDPPADDPPGDAPEVLAADSFDRAVGSGFGVADFGGPWTTTSGAASVGEGFGRLSLAAPWSVAAARLPGFDAAATSTRVTASLDKMINGWLLVRGRITGQGEYRLKLGLSSSGSVTAWFARSNAAGTEVSLSAPVPVSSVSYAPGSALHTRIEVVSLDATTTSLRARVWTGDEEPSTWLIEDEDSTAALQTSGHAGFAALLSGSANNAPVVARFDDFLVTTVP